MGDAARYKNSSGQLVLESPVHGRHCLWEGTASVFWLVEQRDSEFLAEQYVPVEAGGRLLRDVQGIDS